MYELNFTKLLIPTSNHFQDPWYPSWNTALLSYTYGGEILIEGTKMGTREFKNWICLFFGCHKLRDKINC